MPELLTLLGYKVYFWVNEGKPLEPIHVHISKNIHKNATKIWLFSDGTCEIENNRDRIPSPDLKKIIEVLKVYHQDIQHKWEQIFGHVTFKNLTYEQNISR